MTDNDKSRFDGEVEVLIQRFGITNLLYSACRYFTTANTDHGYPGDNVTETYPKHVRNLREAAEHSEAIVNNRGAEVVR